MATAIAVSTPNQEPATIKTVAERLNNFSAHPVEFTHSSYLHEERVLRGDTMGNILARLGVQDPEAVQFIRNSQTTRAMHQQLAPGKVVTARTSENGELQTLYFPLNGRDTALVAYRSQDGHFFAEEQALRLETQIAMKHAEIRSSLFAATDAADIPDNVASQMADIFGGDIDFHRDLRQGDHFAVVYEMLYLNGQPIRSGRIQAAEFVNNGKTHQAIHFERDGKEGYYTSDGRSLKKAFLRSPLEFSRITSGFALRFHPIFQQWKAHKGVDYGAPPGTNVRATGDGIIEFAGQQGGYGNVVIVRHNDSYSTAYGHLLRFAPGTSRGTKVSQGSLVGYVGQTGWATGPHLHYEFRIHGQQVNPLTINAPNSAPLDRDDLAKFKTHAAEVIARLELLRNTKYSAFE